MEDVAEQSAQSVTTIAEAGRLLRAGKLTSVALVAGCLRRIERLDPLLRACVTVMAEAALDQARVADEALQAGRDLGPLHGIPLGIKDLIETRGVRTTAGSAVLADWVPQEDAAVVTRLATAGAIALCKTNTHEFAFGTYSPPTRNPWDTTRVPGGSSGGSAAGVAAGEFLGALGTDTGGSIRIPAGWCGVTGLKPTYGLVSRAGIIPLSGTLDHAGPIARSVEDCALLLDALAGYDPRDTESAQVPLTGFARMLADEQAPDDAVRGLRIGVPSTYFFDQIEGEVAGAVRAAIASLAALGATVEEVALPAMLDDLFPVYRAIQQPEAFVYHSAQGWLTERADRYTPLVRANIAAGADYSAAEYIRALHTRQALTVALEALFARYDVLAMPTLALAAPSVEATAAPLTLDGAPLVGGSLRCTFPFDLTGQPALALPCGFTASGLPISLQLVARRFDESSVLRLGHAYQRTSEWHLRQPPLTGDTFAQ